MKQNKLTQYVIPAMLFIVSAVLCAGSFTFLRTCGPMEDGSWMTCHWAGQAISAVTCVMAILACVNLFVKNSGFRAGISLGLLLMSVTAAFLPGKVIPTCMMPDMQCNAVTRPGVAVLCAVLALLSLINLLVAVKGIKKENKE
ncbi:MAG: DUF4418 family protein [Eubacterium sp.]|nr:DUF4418 family protein [Eubacterium sp.]